MPTAALYSVGKGGHYRILQQQGIEIFMGGARCQWSAPQLWQRSETPLAPNSDSLSISMPGKFHVSYS